MDTLEARADGYAYAEPKANTRKEVILECLGDDEMTVSEIVLKLCKIGKLKYFDRNFVAPRVTELRNDGVLETCGRRKSSLTNIRESIWRKKVS